MGGKFTDAKTIVVVIDLHKAVVDIIRDWPGNSTDISPIGELIGSNAGQVMMP